MPVTTVRRWVSLAISCACAGCARPAPPVTGAVPVPVPPTDRPALAPVAPPAPAPAPMQRFVDSLVALPQFRNANWGILIVAPTRKDTLASVNADKLVMPASNQKLITGAIALARLGPDYTWRTTFTRTGPITGRVLRGDLVVEGTGDVSISTAMRGADPLVAFAPVIDALKAAGVTRIAGRVRPSVTQAFPGSPHGYGWDWDDLATGYGAGVTELMFNEAFTDVRVTGCAGAGKPACITTLPLRTSPVVHAQVTTRAARTGPPLIEWWRDSATVPGISIHGSIAAGDSMTFASSHPDDRATYVAAVTEALRRAGIIVANGVVRGTRADTVAVLTSLPLRQVLAAMQKPSQNQIAEVLFRSVAREATGSGTPDSARAVFERQLGAWGVRPDARAVRDGSGLSRHDYITPRAIVQVLDTMWRSPTFPIYRDALPIAGADGTLEDRMRSFANGRIWAKTGTIDKARAISGYLTTNDGEMLFFSLIANNHTVSNREVERVQDMIVERLTMVRKAAP